MPKYDIKRGATIIASVIAEGSQNVEAMGVNEVNMKFTLINPVVFQVGDWCQVYGNKYVVYRKPEYTKVNERQHEYDLYLVHEFYKLQDSILMGIDKNAILNEKVFYLTGNLQAFADLVLANANRNDTGWTLGTVDSTDAKTMQFDGENILASLNRIASEFETEFWVEGKVISFAKRLTNSGIQLGYGENKGLISITKGNKDANATIFTRLFVEGAERNLPSYTNYGFKRLQLPSANNGKVDNTSAIASFGVIEHYAKFDDIYPKHTGTITSVGDEFTFYDSALPFNINDQLLPGVTAYVAFQSGVLVGYNFDIASFDNATKKFVININEDEKAATLPNTTLKPAVGDTYIVFDIQMPQTHITAAENALLAKANELLAQGSDIDFNDAFSGNCDPLYFKRNSITPVLGQYARLFETNPAIDVTKRMSKISRDLQNPDKYEITFTDKIEVNTVVREYIKNIEETLVVNEALTRTITNRDAVRRAAQRIDVLRGDVFDPDGYFKDGNIRAQTLETIMATFGYNSGRFILEGAAFSLNVGGVANDYSFTSAKLIHFNYDVAGGYEWMVPALTSSFVDSNSGYYIYAKCSKTALTGTWVVNNSKLQVDNETGYYTLLIGRVYPVLNGKREIDLLYGVTNIVGNRIQTGIIQDLAGTNFWNLETGQMKISGQVTIGAGSNVYTKTETDSRVNSKITFWSSIPTTGQYKVNDLWKPASNILIDGVFFLAGKIYTCTATGVFFGQNWKVDETISFGATLPPTNTAKLNDAFIHEADGNAIYVFNGTSWDKKQDTAIAGAVATANAANTNATNAQNTANTANTNATNAQTTANSKSTHYTSKPSSYKAGDLMTPFASFTESSKTFKMGVLYFTETTSATFNKDHWNEKLIYTDNTKAQEALDMANTRGKTTIGLSFPSTPKVGDWHFETSGKKWWEWNGTNWVDSGMTGLNYLYQALGLSTEITGGLVLTNMMGVRNEYGNVTSYVNGLNGSNGVAFAAGVTDFGQVGESRVFSIKHNGDIVIQKSGSKKLEFIASTGALTISGTVNATAGSIGGFTIESDKLKSATPAWGTEALVLNKTANTFEFYSGYQTDDGTQYGNIIPDIKIQAVQGFKDILNSNPVGEIYCGGFYALPTRYSTVVGGNGISSNCSNISFKPDKSESGKESSASIAARIKVDADKIGDSIYGFYSRRISAAIAGVTDLTQGSNDSRTYGGYFNSLFTGTFHTGVKEISSSSTFYLAGEFITTIYCASGASGAWLMFPSINHEEGRVLIVRNSSGGSVYISRTSSENLYLGDNSSVTTTTIGNKRTQIWQRLGNAWRLLIDQAF
jgi:hypothetical protein